MAPNERLKHSVRFWLLQRLATCQSTVETISQSMERTLSFQERVKLKLHLWICVWCQWYLEHLHLIRKTARAETPEETAIADAALSDAARERIRRALTNQN